MKALTDLWEPFALQRQQTFWNLKHTPNYEINENKNMNISELEKEIIAFRDARNWRQFHTVKDLLMGLNIEVSELSELFLWKNELEMAAVDKQDIADELADIFVFLNYLAQHFEIDLTQAVVQKLHKNNLKYPLEKSYNSNKKYNQIWYSECKPLIESSVNLNE